MKTLLSRGLLCLVLFGGLASSLYAQPETELLPGPSTEPIRFEHLTNTDGLSQQNVYAILQDRRGFMWFGTQSGLNRYDGYQFTVYKIDPTDPDSPSGLGTNGWIRSIYEDRDGMLWICYGVEQEGDNPVDRFDPTTETFTHFRHDPDDPGSPSRGVMRDVLEDRDGVLWFAGWGLHRFDRETGTFTHFFPDARFALPEGGDPNNPEHARNRITTLYEDRFGAFWVGTEGGLFRFDRATETFTPFLHDPADPESMGTGPVQAIYEDGAGTLWVGAWGLHRFNRMTETFDPFLPDPRYPDRDGGAGRDVNLVSSILEDRAGTFWVGTGDIVGVRGDGGLFRFDREAGTFTAYQHDPSDPYSLAHNDVTALYEDRQGLLWIGTGKGVDRIDRSTQLFGLYRHVPGAPNSLQGGGTYALHLDRAGGLWVATSYGVLSRIDRQTGVVRHYRNDPADPASLSQGTIWTIEEDQRGHIWVGFEGVGGEALWLNRLDPATGRFKRYRAGPDASTGLRGRGFPSILEDRMGTLWVGTDRLHRYDPATDRFTRFDTDDALVGFADLIEDPAGMLWLGRCGREVGLLSRFNPQTETFTHFRLPVCGSSIYERPQEPGIIWISGLRGLQRFDSSTETWTTYTAQNSGLPNNDIWCVTGDAAGHLWMSTSQGLARFHPDQDAWQVFDMDDGLQGLEFDGKGCHRGHTGELFFSGSGGVNVVQPNATFDNPNPPQVVLTGLRLFNDPVVPGPDAPLRTSLAETEALRFAHDQNDVTLEYVGLHFRHPEKNRYAYRLDGYDEAWRDVGTLRQASYTNLPPGDYTFRVRAANSDGLWSEEGASIGLTILPPWWRTTWAYLLYGLFFLGGVFAVDRFQRRRLIARERERARERELAQAREIEHAYTELKTTQQQLVHSEKMASLGALTAGIAHEIKNPLNFVTNFAALSRELVGDLKDETDPDEIQALLTDLELNTSKIEEHGKRADSIVCSMMQHARAGSGEREVVDLNALVAEHITLAYHGKRAQTPDFNATIEKELDADVGHIEIVPQEIGRVLLNLLGNAFDAVAERAASVNGQHMPTVTVSTQRKDGQIEIRVADNGPGIKESVREKIFEPFFTTKPTGSGTGLGLSLSYDIITQGHGGMLTVESEEGQGAVFVVTLPASRR